jgi:hypothetical protein
MHTVGFTWRLLLDLDINSRGRAAQHSCCKRTNEQGKSRINPCLRYSTQMPGSRSQGLRFEEEAYSTLVCDKADTFCQKK